MTGRTGAVLVALAVVLTGCTSAEPRPPALPPAPSVSPSLAPLPLPPEAAAETAEGAAAFARFYMDVLTRAFQTADAAQLQSLSDPGCGGCRNFIGAVNGSKDKAEVTTGGEFKVVFAVSPAINIGEDVIVDLRYERSAAKIVRNSGEIVADLPPDEPLDALLRLGRRDGGWLVLGLKATALSP